MSEKKELHSPHNVEERRYICGAQLEAISLGPRKGAPRYHRTWGRTNAEKRAGDAHAMASLPGCALGWIRIRHP